MASYFPGNTVRLLAAFSASGTVYDPGTVVFQVIGPGSHAILTPDVVRDSTGEYHADVVADDSGLWTYRIVATLPASAAEGSFVVRDSSFV